MAKAPELTRPFPIRFSVKHLQELTEAAHGLGTTPSNLARICVESFLADYRNKPQKLVMDWARSFQQSRAEAGFRVVIPVASRFEVAEDPLPYKMSPQEQAAHTQYLETQGPVEVIAAGPPSVSKPVGYKSVKRAKKPKPSKP